MTFSKDEKKTIGIVYAVFMILFFFIGIPKLSFGAFVVAFLGTTAFFALAVYLIKRFYVDAEK